jgi:tetratricopeptide (TPR) repeat protein
LRGEPSREHRERISEEAVQTARRIGDPAAVAYALDAAEAALHAPHNAQVRLDEGREIVSLAAATGDRERLFDGHEHAFWAAWELGDPGVREVELRSMAQAGDELRQPAQLWILTVTRATLALAEGGFAEVESLIEEAATVGERAQSRTAAAVAHTLPLFMLRREQGRLAESEREILGPGHEFSGPLVRGSVLAHIQARLERRDEAQAALDELMSRDLSDWHVDEEWLLGICLLAETCVLLEDAERAAPLYELLLPSASLNAIAVPQLALGSTSRPLGMLATLLSRLEDAERHFEEALRMDERMGAWPWLAHTQEEYGRMLHQRNAPGDRERAEQLRSRAHATYDELGMQT